MNSLYKPDVLDLIINRDNLVDFSIGGIDTPFGIDGENYLIKDNQIFGEKVEAEKYYSNIGCDVGDRCSFSLAPSLKRKSDTVIQILLSFIIP